MKTVKAHAIRNAFPQVLRSLKAGERAVITSRGKVPDANQRRLAEASGLAVRP